MAVAAFLLHHFLANAVVAVVGAASDDGGDGARVVLWDEVEDVQGVEEERTWELGDESAMAPFQNCSEVDC